MPRFIVLLSPWGTGAGRPAEVLLTPWLEQVLLSTPDLLPCSDSLYLEWWCTISKHLHSVDLLSRVALGVEKGAKREGNTSFEDGSREMKFSAGGSAGPWSFSLRFSSEALINAPSIS